MPATAKKPTTKATSRTAGAASKSHAATHPSWVDMIKECIIAHPEDARTGVSRPTIKKFVGSKYHIELNASAASQLNRAITSGSEKGIFNLPKGPSGKVKLAARARSDAAKENTKPPAKKLAPTKASAGRSKAPSVKPSSTIKKPVVKAKADTAKTKSTAKAPLIKKSTATTKKAAASKPAPTTKKAATATKKPATTTAAKKSSTKRGAAKKALTGEAKKPVSKPRAKAVAPAVKATPKAKPASKAKVPAKAKIASKGKPGAKARVESVSV